GADALITLGVEYTDNTTAGFSMDLHRPNLVEVSRFEARVGDQVFTPISLEAALEVLDRVVGDVEVPPMPVPAQRETAASREPGEGPLRQDALWEILAAHLQSATIVAAEQGTSYFG